MPSGWSWPAAWCSGTRPSCWPRRPEIDRLVGVFDREHIVQAVRGAANPGRTTAISSGKYHDRLRQLAAEAKLDAEATSRPKPRLPVFEDDRARCA